MDKKFLKLNILFCAILLSLVVWALVDVILLSNYNLVYLVSFSAVLVAFYLIHLFISFLVIIKDKKKIVLNYSKDAKYNYDIINYNFHYCNNIIFSCVCIGLFLMLTVFTALCNSLNFEPIKLSMIIIFVICFVSALIPITYKYIQMQQYIKETNNIAKLIKDGKLG